MDGFKAKCCHCNSVIPMKTIVVMHSCGIITLLAIYKIPKLKYVFAHCAMYLAKVHYHGSFPIYLLCFETKPCNAIW